MPNFVLLVYFSFAVYLQFSVDWDLVLLNFVLAYIFCFLIFCVVHYKIAAFLARFVFLILSVLPAEW